MKNRVLAFSWGQPVHVTEYRNLFDLQRIEKLELTELDKSISRFSLVNYKNQMIYLIGGVDKVTFSAKVFIFDL